MTAKTAVAVIALTLIFASLGVLVWVRYFTGAFSAREQPSLLERWFTNETRHFAIHREAKRHKNPVAYSPEVLEEARAHWAATAPPAMPITAAETRHSDATRGRNRSHRRHSHGWHCWHKERDVSLRACQWFPIDCRQLYPKRTRALCAGVGSVVRSIPIC
jgi:hypothetical protein